MAKVFGGGQNSGSCGSGGILPAPRQQVAPSRGVVSNPNVFKSSTERSSTFDPRDFYTRREIDRYLDQKIDISSVYDKTQTYTQSEVDNKISNLDLGSYALKTYVDSKISQRASQTDQYLVDNYYTQTQLYTAAEIDTLLSSVGSGSDYILKSPDSVDDITIAPANSSLTTSLLVRAANNASATEVQRWENASTDHLASIFADGRIMFSNYVSIGENVDSDGVALSTNERRIEGVADPVNNLDAVNKTYMERFITTTIDDVLTDSDENYLVDALEY